MDEAPDGRRTDTGRRHACSPHTFWDRWRERGRAHSVAAGGGVRKGSRQKHRASLSARSSAQHASSPGEGAEASAVSRGAHRSTSPTSRATVQGSPRGWARARGGREEERERQHRLRGAARRAPSRGGAGGVAPEAAPRGSPAASPFPRVPRVRGGKAHACSRRVPWSEAHCNSENVSWVNSLVGTPPGVAKFAPHTRISLPRKKPEKRRRNIITVRGHSVGTRPRVRTPLLASRALRRRAHPLTFRPSKGWLPR